VGGLDRRHRLGKAAELDRFVLVELERRAARDADMRGKPQVKRARFDQLRRLSR